MDVVDETLRVARRADPAHKYVRRAVPAAAFGLPDSFQGFQIVRKDGRRQTVVLEGAIDLQSGKLVDLTSKPCDRTGRW